MQRWTIAWYDEVFASRIRSHLNSIYESENILWKMKGNKRDSRTLLCDGGKKVSLAWNDFN